MSMWGTLPIKNFVPYVPMHIKHENVDPAVWFIQLFKCQVWHKKTTDEEKCVYAGKSIQYHLKQEPGEILE